MTTLSQLLSTDRGYIITRILIGSNVPPVVSRREQSDLSTGLIFQLLALSTPILVSAVARDTIDAVVSGVGLAAVLAASFVVVWVVGFQFMDLDRVDFLIASVFAPAIAFFAVVVLKSILWQLLNFVEGWPESYRPLWAAIWAVFDFVAPSYGPLFVYVAVFGVAGFVAVWIDRQNPFERLSLPRRGPNT